MITEELEKMARIEDLSWQIWSKRKALIALFPYVVWQDRLGGGDHRMVDAFLCITRCPYTVEFMTGPITTLLAEANSTNRVVTLLSPYADWNTRRLSESTVTWWASAASAIPYTEEVGQSVVIALLKIASNDRLQPYIPIDIWAWLKKRPTLPPTSKKRRLGMSDLVVRKVRELGDVEILESYFLLVWSEWDYVREIHTSIWKHYSGIGMWRHREIFIKRLDHVLGELGKKKEYRLQHNSVLASFLAQQEEIRPYKTLKEALVEVDREALEVLTRTPSRLFSLSGNLLTPSGCAQNPTRGLFVHSLFNVCSHVSITLALRTPNPVSLSHMGSPPPSPLRAPSIVAQLLGPCAPDMGDIVSLLPR